MAPAVVSGADIFKVLLVMRSRSYRFARVKDNSLYHEDVSPAGFQYADDESSETAEKAPFIPIARVPIPVANPENEKAPLMEEFGSATGHRTKPRMQNHSMSFKGVRRVI
jgi:hypothetical protein